MATAVSSFLKGCALALQRAGSRLSATTLGTTSVEAHDALVSTGGAFVAPTAALILSECGTGASVWYSASVLESTLGPKAAVMEGAVVSKCSVGSGSVLGPNCVANAAHIGTSVIIGAGALVLEGSKIHDKAYVAPGAVVAANSTVGQGEVWAGAPAVKVDALPPTIDIDALMALAVDHNNEATKTYQVLLVEEEEYWDKYHRSPDYFKRPDVDDSAVAGGYVPGRILNSPLTGSEKVEQRL